MFVKIGQDPDPRRGAMADVQKDAGGATDQRLPPRPTSQKDDAAPKAYDAEKQLKVKKEHLGRVLRHHQRRLEASQAQDGPDYQCCAKSLLENGKVFDIVGENGQQSRSTSRWARARW
jgi:hypothetical protein